MRTTRGRPKAKDSAAAANQRKAGEHVAAQAVPALSEQTARRRQIEDEDEEQVEDRPDESQPDGKRRNGNMHDEHGG